MTVTDAAYIAALEKKLMEAERALYGFRAIFNNFTERTDELRVRDTECSVRDLRSGAGSKDVGGLYQGQYPNPDTACVD